MLYGLFSLQTNLHISLHNQSDALWHNATNYEQLLFSSDIRAGTSAIGICAFFYRWNLFGVMVLQRCMVIWRRVWGQSAIHIRAFLYMWNWFSVMVLQRSMLIWRRGWGQSAIGICAFFYMWNLWGVMVLQRCMVIWRRGGSVCHRYMCILLYLKLIGCDDVA